MSKTRTGRCACGDVSFTAPDDPLIIHCCHCSWCQRESGASFGLNFLIEADRVEWRGAIEEVLTPSESGKGQRIFRCPTCKIALSSHYPGFGPALHFLRVGAMDDCSGIAPDVHIHIASKQKWVELGDIPAHDGFYDHRETWSAETLSRIRKAMGK